jgi:hypothetical protein
MNDISRIIIRLVHLINEYYGCVKAAYTFDAGPNAVIYTLDKDVDMLLTVMSKYFPPMSLNLSEYCNEEGALSAAIRSQGSLPSDLLASLQRCGRNPVPGDVKYIFVTRSGPGPINVGMEHALLDPATGLPVPPRPEHRQLKVGVVSSSTTAEASPSSSPVKSACATVGPSASCCPASSSSCCGCPLLPIVLGTGLLVAAFMLGRKMK